MLFIFSLRRSKLLLKLIKQVLHPVKWSILSGFLMRGCGTNFWCVAIWPQEPVLSASGCWSWQRLTVMYCDRKGCVVILRRNKPLLADAGPLTLNLSQQSCDRFLSRVHHLYAQWSIVCSDSNIGGIIIWEVTLRSNLGRCVCIFRIEFRVAIVLLIVLKPKFSNANDVWKLPELTRPWTWCHGDMARLKCRWKCSTLLWIQSPNTSDLR